MTKNVVYSSAMALAKAANGNPVLSTATVMLFYVMFSVFEAGMERLLFGGRFEHWLDPAFQLAFIGYAAFSVYACAVHNSSVGHYEYKSEQET